MDGTWIPIIAIACAPVIAIGVPIARAWARRIEAQGQQARVPSDVSARLERMEQAIDAIAVEIERVAEAQRFTTRLLADQSGRAVALGQGASLQQVGARTPEEADVR
jgi:hypothetical protein